MYSRGWPRPPDLNIPPYGIVSRHPASGDTRAPLTLLLPLLVLHRHSTLLPQDSPRPFLVPRALAPVGRRRLCSVPNCVVIYADRFVVETVEESIGGPPRRETLICNLRFLEETEFRVVNFFLNFGGCPIEVAGDGPLDIRR